VEKYYTVGQVTDDNNAHAHFMLDTKGDTHTHSEYVRLLPFHSNKSWMNAPQCYALRAVPALLNFTLGV